MIHNLEIHLNARKRERAYVERRGKGGGGARAVSSKGKKVREKIHQWNRYEMMQVKKTSESAGARALVRERAYLFLSDLVQFCIQILHFFIVQPLQFLRRMKMISFRLPCVFLCARLKQRFRLT